VRQKAVSDFAILSMEGGVKKCAGNLQKSERIGKGPTNGEKKKLTLHTHWGFRPPGNRIVKPHKKPQSIRGASRNSRQGRRKEKVEGLRHTSVEANKPMKSRLKRQSKSGMILGVCEGRGIANGLQWTRKGE